MKKKNKITILVVIILIAIIIGVLYKNGWYIIRKVNPNYIINKANMMYGEGTCSEKGSHIASDVYIGEVNCPLCGEIFIKNNGGLDFCSTCAEVTGRCRYCGKFLKK